MRKLFVLILTVLLTTPLAAQTHRQADNSRYHHDRGSRYFRDGRNVYYGLRLGLNLAYISSEDIELDADCLAGLYLAGVIGIQLSPQAPVSLEVGLAYSEKGGIRRDNGYKVRYRMNSILMPIVAKYNIDVKHVRIQPFFGGYLAIGAAGKIKDYQTKEVQSTYDLFERFDGGLRLGCGVEYHLLYLEAGMDLGLANINKDNFETAHNRCFFISAGVNF